MLLIFVVSTWLSIVVLAVGIDVVTNYHEEDKNMRGPIPNSHRKPKNFNLLKRA